MADELDPKAPPTQAELRSRAERLIKTRYTMTLATAMGGVAWAAPVYYVSLKFSFYFFSDPSSRHIQEAICSEQVSAAIYGEACSWQEIRGIQMSGRIHQVRPSRESVRAIRAYLAKFPFTRELFDPGQPISLEGFAQKFRVRLYRLEPIMLYYLDNQIRFGFRERVPLKDPQ